MRRYVAGAVLAVATVYAVTLACALAWDVYLYPPGWSVRP